MDAIGQSIHELMRNAMRDFQRVLPSFPALLGDGRGNVAIASQPGFVWVRLGLEGEEGLGMAWNQEVQERDGLTIKVGYKAEAPELFQILCQREVYAGTGQPRIAQVVPHGETHIWAHPHGGNDPVFPWWRQIMDFRCRTVSGFLIQVEPGVWRGWTYLEAQQLDLSSYKPSGSAARYVLIYLDYDGTACVRAGSIVYPKTKLSLVDCPGIFSGEKPLAAIALYGDQSEIRDSDDQFDIVDLRWPEFGSMEAINSVNRILGFMEADIDMLLTRMVLRQEALRQDAIHRELDWDFEMTMHRVHGN